MACELKQSVIIEASIKPPLLDGTVALISPPWIDQQNHINN